MHCTRKKSAGICQRTRKVDFPCSKQSSGSRIILHFRKRQCFNHHIRNRKCYVLFYIFKASTQRRTRWLNLVPGGTLQGNCNREGVNNVINAGTEAKVRIGILGNNENDCNTPDSAIGIGIGGSHLSSSGIRTGSTYHRVAGKGYIFIR